MDLAVSLRSFGQGGRLVRGLAFVGLFAAAMAQQSAHAGKDAWLRQSLAGVFLHAAIRDAASVDSIPEDTEPLVIGTGDLPDMPPLQTMPAMPGMPGAEAKTLEDGKALPAAALDIPDAMGIFGRVLETVRTHFVEDVRRDVLVRAALAGALDRYPSRRAQSVALEALAEGCPAEPDDACLSAFKAALTAQSEDYPDRVGDLVDAALVAMLLALDIKSTYLTPERLEAMQAIPSGIPAGIDATMTMEAGALEVVALNPDGPGARAGLLAGDRITHVDGAPVEGHSLWGAELKLYGAADSSLTLTVLRSTGEGPVQIVVTRQWTATNAMAVRSEDDVAYIGVDAFDIRTVNKVTAAIARLKRQIGPRLKGYILDLRDIPDGSAGDAAALCDVFLTGGAIVSLRGREPQAVKSYDAREGDIAEAMPLVVLVNENSANAPEIVAAALQFHGRATIIGAPTSGDGTLRTVVPVTDGGAVLMPTARYYGADGVAIHGRGVAPDILVLRRGVEAGDVQKQAALTFLRSR